MTYDTMGRLKTSTNGRGITTTYTYDNNDKVTKTAFSDGSQVTYGYDGAGRLNNRVDATGTTTWVYDDLGRLTSRQNTAGGGAVTYGYDRASRMTTSTSTQSGAVTYGYDLAGLPTTITYPAPGGGTDTMVLAYDSRARLTSTTLDSTSSTSYAARATYGYNTSGRVTSVTANTGPGTANVVNLAYCYVAGTTPAGGCNASATNDRSKVAWRKNNVTGSTATYTYDTSGRLTQVGGSDVDTFGYDTRNNRTSASPVPGAASGTQALTFNAANQITTGSYAYDGAGNVTDDDPTGAVNVGYTGADQLKSITMNYGSTFAFKHADTTNNELIEQNSADGKYEYTYGRTSPRAPASSSFSRSQVVREPSGGRGRDVVGRGRCSRHRSVVGG